MLEKLPPRLAKKITIAETGCWLWKGAHTSDGHGLINKKYYGHALIHRFVYTVLKGEIPEGLQLDHLCRVTNCVNPDHLEPVTHFENCRRGDIPWAVKLRTGLCRHGHKLEGDNLRIMRQEGYDCRVCRECDRIKSRRYLMRKRQTATQSKT